jgi:pyridoxamine 5'-phosphate oxidase
VEIHALRRDYAGGELRRADLAPDPIDQFRAWFADATACASIVEPNAMTLGTADEAGNVTSRVVLLKAAGQDGFRFFTNYESCKGRQIAANPRVALSFYWAPLERQVLIGGMAEMLGREESEAYFQARPLASQIGAWASRRQGEVIVAREILEQAWAECAERFSGKPVPLPPTWGGYLVRPATIEFWQGRASRLHDRFLYTAAAGGSWRIDRLSP